MVFSLSPLFSLISTRTRRFDWIVRQELVTIDDYIRAQNMYTLRIAEVEEEISQGRGNWLNGDDFTQIMHEMTLRISTYIAFPRIVVETSNLLETRYTLQSF